MLDERVDFHFILRAMADLVMLSRLSFHTFNSYGLFLFEGHHRLLPSKCGLFQLFLLLFLRTRREVAVRQLAFLGRFEQISVGWILFHC